jgi:hypothetical protein
MKRTKKEAMLKGASRNLFPDKENDADGLNRSSRNGAESTKRAPAEFRGKNGPKKSPTSIIDHPSPISQLCRSPMITLTDDGAEITLKMSTLAVSTPPKLSLVQAATNKATSNNNNVLREVRNTSLLDIDKTPSRPSKNDTSTTPPATLMMCCTGTSTSLSEVGFWQDENDHGVSVQEHFEQTISKFLGDTTSNVSCLGWQSWGYFNLLDEEDDEAEASPELKEDIRRVLRNRAHDTNARKSRVQRLSKDLSPFHTSPHEKANNFFPSRSFSIADHAPAIMRLSREQPPKQGLAYFFKGCTSPQQGTVIDSPVLIRGEVCYDSDPEDFARRRPAPKNKSTQKAYQENLQNYESYSYPRSVSTAPTGTMTDLHNDAAFQAVVQVRSQSFRLHIIVSFSFGKSLSHAQYLSLFIP